MQQMAVLDDYLEIVNIQAKADKYCFITNLSAQFSIPEINVKIIIGAVSSPADAFMVLQQYQRGKGKGWGAGMAAATIE